MSTQATQNTHPAPEDKNLATLEKYFIEEYLKSKGHSKESLKSLPVEQARQLMKESSTHASGKLAEIETRARFVHKVKEAGYSVKS